MFWRPSICICGHFDHGKIYGYQMVFHVTWIIKKKKTALIRVAGEHSTTEPVMRVNEADR